jgi:hypothetical protein
MNFEKINISSNRVLDENLFFFLLDLEVKRARRYQNFICLISIRLNDISRKSKLTNLRVHQKNLSDFLSSEIRESDIIASIGEDRVLLLLPYADVKTGQKAKQRVEEAIKYLDFKKNGIEITLDQFCFPINGADSMDLIKRFLGPKS